MAELRTLVVAGEYTEFDGEVYVPERHWRMVQIFSDVLAQPVFGRRHIASSDRTSFSTRFPHPDRLVAVNSHLHRRPWELALPDLLWNRSGYERILEDVDAVYCRFPSCHWEGVHLYNLALARNKIVFASLHGDWPETYRHAADHGRFPKSWIDSRNAGIVRGIFSHVVETARVLFCVGSDLGRRYGDDARASVVFANYLHRESDLFVREDTCLKPSVRVLYVGDLHARKGIPHLIDAVARLRDAGVPLVLSIVGHGEQGEALRKRAASHGLSDQFEMHGYVPFGPRLFELYRESDLFVLPSLAGEGAPKVVVEAMSQGLPVVASDVGSTASMLTESAGGIAVPPGDVDALVKALRRIIEDSGLRRSMIRNGLEFARRMTNEHQRSIVASGLRQHVPELTRADF